MFKIVLLRHGESTWNQDNKFTGWTDVGLTEKGERESVKAAKLLKDAGLTFDMAFTAVLKRATITLDIVLEKMGLDIPVKKSWRLNEKHYGALQGLNKAETAKKQGEEQVLLWRRAYDVRPPALEESDERHPVHDPLYEGVDRKLLPSTECLKDVVARFLPYWTETIAPAIKSGKSIIISAHGNSLRALVKHLDSVSDDEIIKLNIPTGVPLVYELDDELKPIRHYYLGDPEEIERARKAVENQGKAK